MVVVAGEVGLRCGGRGAAVTAVGRGGHVSVADLGAYAATADRSGGVDAVDKGVGTAAAEWTAGGRPGVVQAVPAGVHTFIRALKFPLTIVNPAQLLFASPCRQSEFQRSVA